MNIYPAMMIMLIENKYLVEGVENASDLMAVKICFVKEIQHLEIL